MSKIKEIEKLLASVTQAEEALRYAVQCCKMVEEDRIFIKHIQNHLQNGQEVICKICGKTAKEIVKERRQK